MQQTNPVSNYEEGVQRLISRFRSSKVAANRRTRHRQKVFNQRHSVTNGDFVEQSETVRQQIDVPVKHRCQILVLGGGPAGISAALASARAGADTLIVERYGCFGGVITTCGMETLGWYRYEGTSDTEGIGRELERVAESMGATRQWPFNESPCLDTERFKVIADELLTEAGVRPLLHTFVVDALVRETKPVQNALPSESAPNSSLQIFGVVVENKGGRSAIIADRVIDCTGDADVAFHAGCSYTQLSPEDALGVTGVFNVSEVDVERFQSHIKAKPATYTDWSNTWHQETTGKEDNLNSPYWDEEFQRAVSSGAIAKPESGVELSGSWSSLTENGEATNLNLVHLSGVDATNPEALTRAEMAARKHTASAIHALRTQVPGFERCRLRNFAMGLGIRDSRKVDTLYSLTVEDVLGQARFDDAIGTFPEFVDGYSLLVLPTTGRYFQVPLRSVLTGVENLLVAGRCIGGDMGAHAATRNMMCCCVTGQGAGAAAAVSLHEGKPVQEVAIKQVQDELSRQGVRLGHASNDENAKSLRSKL